MRTALAAHDDVITTAIADNDGHVFSTAGDGYAASFARPKAALQAALNAQSGLSELSVGGNPLKVRMAVHTGSADERDGDYFGPAVNRAARLMSIGNGGQILVSTATALDTQDSLPWGAALRDLGEHRLKDLSRAEHVYRLDHPSLEEDDRPLRSLDAFLHNLPIQLTSFVGREQELDEVVKLLGGARMVTLAGVGGAGKTRLAIQTGAEMLTHYQDGVWLVELAPITDPSRITVAVMDVLGIEEKPDEEADRTLARSLARKSILLILDNCEHVVDSAARLAVTALGAGPGVTILATSREMLGVPGEYPYQVKSLASPDSIDAEVQAALLRYPAVRLFSERAELARPGWRISAESADSVVQICRRLDGMPLAIELAAARLRMMPADKIAERLDDRFRLLTGGSRTVLPRQQTLEAAIDWSFDLLDQDEKTLFARLALFMGGFTLEAAESACGVAPLDEFAVLDLLGNLVDKSLVQAEVKKDGLRYRMLETLRQYARLKLAESEDIHAMRRSHAEYFLSLVREASPSLRGPDEAYWFARLDEDLDNLRQALTWSIEEGEADIAQSLAGSLYRYFMYRFRFVEGREWAERALVLSDRPTEGYARALLAAGTLAQFSLDQDASMKHLDQAIDLARELDLTKELSAALNNRANVASGMGMTEEALRLHEEHLALDRRLGVPDGIIVGLMNVSSLNLDLGNAELALELAEEALEASNRLDSDRMVFHSRLWSLAPLRTLGRFDEMELHLNAMRDIEESPGNEFIPGVVDFWTSVVHLERNDVPSAIRTLREALNKFHSMPDPYEVIAVASWILELGAHTLDRVGSPELAARLLGSADATMREKAFERGGDRLRHLGAVEKSIRAKIGDEAYESEFGAGTKMQHRDAHEALAVALAEYVEENGSQM